ncbi:MAG: ABC transporter permease [Candidatus Thermochlorobacter aerophilum]|uniref:Cell division protein FtsX n=1 Tax=Candidatus Thermochlorobacter aerophilus TaxID=1868324 RepID=A0A395M0S3_9BACT|nr:MAG: ABC transporter permease [Candidatus Thermochlorobacter aerophilum]
MVLATQNRITIFPNAQDKNLNRVDAERMNIPYILKESFSGFRRARLSTLISILTVAVSLVLLGVFLILTQSAARVLEEIRSRVEIEFFLSEAVSVSEAKAIAEEIARHPAVAKSTFISKETAAKIFEQEFGEKIEQILGTNPLPQSIKVNLKPEYATLDSLEKFARQASQYQGILEARYNKELLSSVDSNARVLVLLTAGLGILISLAAVALVSNTIRLAIYSKREIIRTMKLVGATFNFIRMPFLLEGLFQGAVGGLLATALLLLLMLLLSHGLPEIYTALEPMSLWHCAVLVLTGSALGLLGSFFSVRKFIDE